MWAGCDAWRRGGKEQSGQRQNKYQTMNASHSMCGNGGQEGWRRHVNKVMSVATVWMREDTSDASSGRSILEHCCGMFGRSFPHSRTTRTAPLRLAQLLIRPSDHPHQACISR